MRNLLPDTIAFRAMLLLVVGLAVTHLVSNLFYASDRQGALLSEGGEHAIQWVAMTSASASENSTEAWANLIQSARDDSKFVTRTKEAVVRKIKATDWREVALQQELARHVNPKNIPAYRIAYAPIGARSAASDYWQGVLSEHEMTQPMEMIFVSVQLENGEWLNMATPIQSPPSFFSARLGWSMAVMLTAVILISGLIVGRMTDPLKQLSRAAEKLGTDVQAPAIPETGPEEVRRTAQAFNVMQNRIRRFVEDRTQMLGAIAHDLGTPITRLRLRAEFVEDVELREKMLRDLDDMQHMVASTLSFIREDAASEPQVTVDLGSLLARVCDDLTDGGANVSLEDIPRWVLVDCRPVALRRALSNLIENAVKYGQVARVSLTLAEKRLHILIEDDGPGIPVERQEDVFQPFHRLEDSRNRETGGTGLGLPVARTIIRAHGGDIALTNRSAGGLCVEIKLPRPNPAEKEQGSPTKKSPAARTADQGYGPKTGQSSAAMATDVTRFSPATRSVDLGREYVIQSGVEARETTEGNKEWKTL